MPPIRYRYQPLEPPAPFVNAILRHPVSGAERRDVPAQVDSAADRTVLPEALAQALGLPRVGRLEVLGLGGVHHLLPTFAVLLSIQDLPAQQLEVLANPGEPWILLGRDALNAHRMMHDGPGKILDVG